MKKILVLFMLIPTLLVGCSVASEKPIVEKINVGAPEPDLASGTQPAGSKVVSDTNQDIQPPASVDPSTPVSYGITVNTINFKNVDFDNLSQEQKDQIEQNREKRGYSYFPKKDGGYLLVIHAGQKPTTGYSIEVVSIQDNEGKTNVVVKETKPTGFTGQMVTYPLTIVEFSGTTDQFNITTLNNETLQQIK